MKWNQKFVIHSCDLDAKGWSEVFMATKNLEMRSRTVNCVKVTWNEISLITDYHDSTLHYTQS